MKCLRIFFHRIGMYPRVMKKVIYFIVFLLLFIVFILYSQNKYYSNFITKKPIVITEKFNYGVIIDAGSSGSRLFVYKWPPHSGKSHELLKISSLLDKSGKAIVKKVSPGLSSLADKPEKTAEYIKPLLDLATISIPSHMHLETPLYIMATAGMRMIKKESREAILKQLREYVKKNYHFLFSDNHAKVITGKEEGIYGWIASNYLLGRFNHNHTDGVRVVSIKTQNSPYKSDSIHHRKRTVGVMDMGGGSMQIAYELSPNSDTLQNMDGVETFSLGCTANDVDHTYRLFVTTFLGFGANAARARYERVLLYQYTRTNNKSLKRVTNPTKNNSSPILIHDPCLHPALHYTTKVKLVNDSVGGLQMSPSEIRNSPSRQVQFQGTGQFHQCESKMLNLLNKRPCHKPAKSPITTTRSPIKQCVMNKREHPKVDLKNTEFYGFSEFWYSTNDVLGLGGPYNYFKIHSKSVDYCKQNWHAISLLNKKNAKQRLDWPRFRYQCFKAAWLTTVLHEGLEFPRTFSHFKSVHEIDNTEVQWSLGALIYQTRYFPLRAIEKAQSLFKQRSATTYRNTVFSLPVMMLLGGVVGLVLFVLYSTIHITPKTNNSKFHKMLNYFDSVLNKNKVLISVNNNDGPLLPRYSKVKSAPNFKDWV